MSVMLKQKIILSAVLFFLLFPFATICAQSVGLGQKANFFIDPNYDLSQRDRISAILQRAGNNAYFYVDEQWWNSLTQEEKDKMNESLKNLDQEFYSKIYPVLISTFGLEWRPGIDNDTRITILIHPMQEDAGGYFAEKDEYPRLAITNSNEREMVYLNSKYIDTAYSKSFLAHEFTHLITFNQKDKTRGVSEDAWLNEARAEYAPTLSSYDLTYDDSNLQRRVKKFLEKPGDPLTEWQNISSDYGVINLFIQYLVDHYGVKILSDSLQSTNIGIQSLDYALKKNNFKEDFSQVFTDWTIAVLINDCSVGIKYCYLNQNLKNLRIVPQINVLPSGGRSTLTITNATKNWAGNWYKIIGGKGLLKLKFAGNKNISFKVPYIIKNSNGAYTVGFLTLDTSHQGEIPVEDFGTENNALFLIPTIQNKDPEFSSEPFYSFSWSVSVAENSDNTDEINRLLAIIDSLKKQIAAIIAQKNGQSGAGSNYCLQINSNLSFGMQNSNEIRCLQEFLKKQGADIYPEGFVTGNFGNLTRLAVIKFQERYAPEILAPIGLSNGTGYVGERTKQKINQILGGG